MHITKEIVYDFLIFFNLMKTLIQKQGGQIITLDVCFSQIKLCACN
jgi:hypothetical protein